MHYQQYPQKEYNYLLNFENAGFTFAVIHLEK